MAIDTVAETMEPNRLAELGVLGVLAEESADRERVRDRLQHNVGRYWTAGHGALEPAFERLRADEHIVAVSPSGDDGSHRGVEYAITDGGRNRLRELLKEPIPDDDIPTRQPQFMLKLGFLHHLSAAEQTDQLAALADQFERVRDRWVDIKTGHEDAVPDPRGYRRELQELTIRLTETYLEWVNDLQRDR
ncbi:helix-turn-helix transcriptional regulator [Natrinema salsiterrestre]|uniref:Helix-turn-helix transcriptional regulator n=1 Tax=Natrinema salsiterrestre TaxID=2950540 RepID=A0A9Q4KXT0_9EURY|nr:helix-turn-helix transcriptional regulator [Natrinema salsiterrestre]MDF9745540.1 helix-turn-helix transcriptional regulator [Natrinema salsiterrestre]